MEITSSLVKQRAAVISGTAAKSRLEHDLDNDILSHVFQLINQIGFEEVLLFCQNKLSGVSAEAFVQELRNKQQTGLPLFKIESLLDLNAQGLAELSQILTDVFEGTIISSFLEAARISPSQYKTILYAETENGKNRTELTLTEGNISITRANGRQYALFSLERLLEISHIKAEQYDLSQTMLFPILHQFIAEAQVEDQQDKVILENLKTLSATSQLFSGINAALNVTQEGGGLLQRVNQLNDQQLKINLMHVIIDEMERIGTSNILPLNNNWGVREILEHQKSPYATDEKIASFLKRLPKVPVGGVI